MVQVRKKKHLLLRIDPLRTCSEKYLTSSYVDEQLVNLS